MFREEFEAAAKASEGKLGLLKTNPLGYFLLSMLAGAYIGFGVLLTNSIGAQLNGAACTKLVMGLSFGVALSLVTIAGAELFTGNNLVMAAGLLEKRVRLSQAVLLWCVCWLGNLCGSALLACVYALTGLGGGAGEDDRRVCSPAGAGSAVQHAGVPRGLVRLSRKKRRGQAHHGLLVPVRLCHHGL